MERGVEGKRPPPRLRFSHFLSLSPPLSLTTTVALLTHALLGSAGTPPPPSYTHADGGVYVGQWAGRSKEGLGVYTYPSGARYEGQWASGRKAGRGVFHFKDGSTYAGEWREGVQDGIGVRARRAGGLKAGFWRGGALEGRLPLWQCAAAVAGARDAAAAARAVPVGGGTLGDAMGAVLTSPLPWAVAAGAAGGRWGPGLASLLASALGPAASGTLGPRLASAGNLLASAHIPLALLAAGVGLAAGRGAAMATPTPTPTSAAAAEVAAPASDVAAVLGLRWVALLAATALAAFFAPLAAWPAVLAVATGAVASPPPPDLPSLAARFGLNDALAARCMRTGAGGGLLLGALLALVGTAAGGARAGAGVAAVAATAAAGLGAASAFASRSASARDRAARVAAATAAVSASSASAGAFSRQALKAAAEATAPPTGVGFSGPPPPQPPLMGREDGGGESGPPSRPAAVGVGVRRVAGGVLRRRAGPGLARRGGLAAGRVVVL